MNIYSSLYESGIINPISKKYQWISNIEFFSKDKLEYYHKEIYDEMKMVMPFASTSGGDVFGWYVEDNQQLEYVVMCNHDDGESVFYAADICSAIFRKIIEFANEEEFSDGGVDDTITLSTAHKLIEGYIIAFSPYFKSEYIEQLKQLLNRPLKKVDDGCGYEYMALLDCYEVEEIIENLLRFDRLNEEFNCYE